MPVFYVETPSPVTVKGMAATMLARLGNPACAHRRVVVNELSAGPVNDGLSRGAGDPRRLHHLIDQETNRILEQVSDWLKVLIKETNIPFLVMGH